ncbi:OmpA family protein [Mesonia sediminis]|uniref:OmpA family protein n=1 Tax=Mesonia sediminis TaxID=1703946 RepID=A0ABW5SB92_9FLAO
MKMRNITYLLFLIVFFFQSALLAQEDKLKEADKMFDRYAFIDAREIYLEVAKAGYESENLFKKLGDSYYFNGELTQALNWYEKLYALKTENLDESYLFRYAMALKSNEQYKKSDSVLLEFEKLKENDSRVELLKGERNYLELIELQSGKFEIELANINSKLSDFSPQVVDSLLIFASNKEVASTVKRVHEWNKQPYLDLYFVKLNEDNQIVSEPTPFEETINSKFHESSACMTKDGLTLYFTRNNYNKKKYGKSEEGINFLKIYKSERESIDAPWGTPEELPFNNDNYSVAHPTLNKDETKLFFASDMPGTRGMSDIYFVEILADGFGDPVNLGEHINTEARETFPYFSDKNELYFASDGHIGLGGLDVFVTVLKEDGTFGEVFNVGAPINSSKDDFSFVFTQGSKKGFFASNRPGGLGEDDIYHFTQKEDLITACQQYVSGVITQTENQQPIAGVKVELYDENLTFLDETVTDDEGGYEFTLDCDTRYIIRVSKDQFKTDEKLLKSGSEFEKNFDLPLNVEKGGNSTLGVTKAGKGDDLRSLLQLDPIYFDLDDSQIRADAEVELQKIVAVLKKYPEMKIDIRSHTDSRAGDAYNMLLSEKRAQATLSYLRNQGISSKRISGKGYGETQLINHCENNVPCSEQEHQLNRRSEFIILNDNETPEELRKNISKRQLESQQIKDKTENNKLTTTYDFTGNEIYYTVQIAAVNKNNPLVRFNEVSSVFNHVYPDGLRRYFSKLFKTREEAEQYKMVVREAGIQGAFVVGIQGQNRF